MAKSNRTPEAALPKGKVPIHVSRTPVTGQGGKPGVKMAPLGPTPVGVHGPDGIHQAIKNNTMVRPTTPNPHVVESHTPGVGVRNTPTKPKR
jgi:hypothetical protein